MTIEPHLESDDVARKAIADLFAHPPVSSIDLRARLASIHRPSARHAAVDKLKSRELTDRDGPLILAILDVIGIGQERSRLVATALDTEGEARVRMWAAMALAGDDPRMMDLLVTELGPEGMAHLAENALIDLMTIQQPDRIGKTIVRALEEWHRDLSSERLLTRIEACRRGIGISCAEAYGPALMSGRLELLWSKILDFFVWEAADEGIEFLESLRERNETCDRRELQSALLRLRSAKIDPKHRSQGSTGHGFVSNCDGNGGFIVLGVFDNPDATQSISELYLHVFGEVLDGVVHPRLRKEQAEEVVDHLKLDAGCCFVPVRIEDSAALAAVGVEKIGTVIDNERGEIRQALRLFSRVALSPFTSEPPPFVSMPAVSQDEIHALLSRKEYQDTWFFDASDLEAEGIVIPMTAPRTEEWFQAAVERIAGSPKKEQIAAMAEHMSKWHAWNSENDASMLCAALARDIRRSPSTSRLIRYMLEHSPLEQNA